ncbi:uncharacterized protein [Choristoneura fumiferana]|uniref:uncharacterized protein n=1 Tax=Choristoneura fumiferana TaxID=7141 RepID=UPI003D15D98D
MCSVQDTSNSWASLPPHENLHVTGRLPQMELAKFDGDVLKWHQFWDQFTSNVDSRNLNDVDKLLYLQSVLSSEAKQAIEGLDTTNKNYKIAVETLKERYGKPAAIIDAHYVALYRIQTAGNTAKECRNVLNEIERHLRVLKSLGEDVNHNHLRVMIMEKFPEDLIYELRMKLDKDDESIETIRKNLEHIISARETSSRLKREIVKGNTAEQKFTLETLHVRSDKSDNSGSRHGFRAKQQNFRHERNRNFDTKPVNKFSQRKRPFEVKSNQNNKSNIKRTKMSCIFCHMDHFNDECTSFKSINERKQKLMGRCYNCFGEKHSANDCKFKRKCRHCGVFGQHNRALCPSKAGNQDATKMLYADEDRAITVLQTCTVQVHDTEDSSRYAVGRVLLDCGSQRSYITAEMGIIEIVDEPLQTKNHPVHYLPLHGVSAEGKSLRIVYDGSSKIKDSYSLNECLYRGPLMLEDLIGLIIRFREHAVGIVADVEKAFLQIGLQKEDRDATRFLWVKDLNREMLPCKLMEQLYTYVHITKVRIKVTLVLFWGNLDWLQ